MAAGLRPRSNELAKPVQRPDHAQGVDGAVAAQGVAQVLALRGDGGSQRNTKRTGSRLAVAPSATPKVGAGQTLSFVLGARESLGGWKIGVGLPYPEDLRMTWRGDQKSWP